MIAPPRFVKFRDSRRPCRRCAAPCVVVAQGVCDSCRTRLRQARTWQSNEALWRARLQEMRAKRHSAGKGKT